MRGPGALYWFSISPLFLVYYSSSLDLELPTHQRGGLRGPTASPPGPFLTQRVRVGPGFKRSRIRQCIPLHISLDSQPGIGLEIRQFRARKQPINMARLVVQPGSPTPWEIKLKA